AGGLEFWVDDEGPGPKDPDDTGLFEQFHRSGGEDPDESGLGLGLFIVRSIVERHGGSVSLERTSESRTHAVVELPKEPPESRSCSSTTTRICSLLPGSRSSRPASSS